MFAYFTGKSIKFVTAKQSTTYLNSEYFIAPNACDGDDKTCAATDNVEKDRYWQGELNVTITLDYVIILPEPVHVGKFIFYIII